MLLTLLFAVLAACANALSSVMQRKAAVGAPTDQGEAGLLRHQLRTPAFYAGIGGLIAGFLLQGAALSQGQLSVVQPILVTELPLTLFIAAAVFSTPVGRREIAAAVTVAAGVGVALACADPSGGKPTASHNDWAAGAGGTVAVLALVAVLGWRSTGPRRAALLGTVAGGGFALTATFMSPVAEEVQRNLGEVVTSWQVYAMVATGIAAVLMLQNAYQAGALAVAQPGVTITDPVLAVVLGVVLFDEHLRLGWFILPELAGLLGIIVGIVVLSRSPTVTGAQDQHSSPDEQVSHPVPPDRV